MLKVTRSSELGRTTLKVEGRLMGRNVSEFATVCLPLLDHPEELVIDLSGVAYIDDAAIKVVRDLIRRNIKVRGCSPLLTNLLMEPQT